MTARTPEVRSAGSKLRRLYAQGMLLSSIALGCDAETPPQADSNADDNSLSGGTTGNTTGDSAREPGPAGEAVGGGGMNARDAEQPDLPLPPQLAACSRSADCPDGEICAIEVDGDGVCILGSSQPCDDGLTCIKDMGFAPGRGIEGPQCFVGGECQVVGGHMVGLCVDTGRPLFGNAPNGETIRECVPVCQYAFDSDLYPCATHPALGLREDCSRTNARVFVAVAAATTCFELGQLTQMVCEMAAPASVLSAEVNATIQCVEAEQNPCDCFFSDLAASDRLFAAAEASGTRWVFVEESSGSSGVNGECGTDCDCGRCNYCERSGNSGVCRYGGEGPYGCYRGCN